MIKVRDESDLRNWFKKNYKKLGFSKILESHTTRFPDFIMLENGKKVKVELETKSSNYLLHKHPINKNIKLVCIIKDTDINIPIIIIDKIRLMKFEEGESRYSFKKQIYKIFKKNSIFTITEIANLFKINFSTAERALLELVIDGKIERIKKEGVTLWLSKSFGKKKG